MGGLTVSNLRASLDDTKVEDILLVRLNLLKVEVVEKGLGLMDREGDMVKRHSWRRRMGGRRTN